MPAGSSAKNEVTSNIAGINSLFARTIISSTRWGRTSEIISRITLVPVRFLVAGKRKKPTVLMPLAFKRLANLEQCAASPIKATRLASIRFDVIAF